MYVIGTLIQAYLQFTIIILATVGFIASDNDWVIVRRRVEELEEQHHDKT